MPLITIRKALIYIRNDEGVVLNDKIVFVQIYIPNIKEKWYTNGIKSLSDLEKYLLLLVETSISESKKLAKGDIIMEDYIEDAIDSTQDEWFGEAYDKEWALKDQGFREGIERGIEQKQNQIVKNLLERNYDLKEIANIVGLTEEKVNEIKEVLK